MRTEFFSAFLDELEKIAGGIISPTLARRNPAVAAHQGVAPTKAPKPSPPAKKLSLMEKLRFGSEKYTRPVKGAARRVSEFAKEHPYATAGIATGTGVGAGGLGAALLSGRREKD